MTKQTETSDSVLSAVQMRAVASLRKAFQRCEKVGVAIYGVDNTVLAIRRDVLNGAPITEIASEKQFLIETVIEGGAYVDSGGW